MDIRTIDKYAPFKAVRRNSESALLDSAWIVPKTVLIVVDDLCRHLVTSTLTEAEGYRVLIANTGAIGLSHSREHRGEIDLLIATVKLPGMSGIDLANALTPERPRLNVLLIGNKNEPRPQESECWHFLKMPFTAAVLRAEISGILN